MSTAGTPAQVAYTSADQAEAAARDFQRRGYRRRTRSPLLPGDVLVTNTAEGFCVAWLPAAPAARPAGTPTRRRSRRA